MKIFIPLTELYLLFIWTRLNESLDICGIPNTGMHNKYTQILKARDDSSMHNVFFWFFVDFYSLCRLLLTVYTFIDGVDFYSRCRFLLMV